MMGLEADLKEQIRKEVRDLPHMQRQSMPGTAERSQEEMSRREEFGKAWEALCEEGEAKGYLDWTNEYSGSHLYATYHDGSTFTHGTRWLETESEWRQRVNEEVNRRYKELIKSLMNGGA